MKVGFAGAGKIGCTLGLYLKSKGIAVAGYWSRRPQSAEEAANLAGSRAFPTLPALIEACDAVFLTVPDGALAEVWEQTRAASIRGKSICHCSGSLSSGVFDGIAQTGACGYSLHPLFAAHDKSRSWREMDAVYFTLEGEGETRPTMEALLQKLGNPWSNISPEKKTLYHAACVAASNLMVGLAKVGTDLFAQCGLEDDFAQNAWRPLFLKSAAAICNAGVQQALTGPVERGDAGTVRRHLSALDPPALEIYRALSGVLVGVAQEKHPDRDYTEVKKELSI